MGIASGIISGFSLMPAYLTGKFSNINWRVQSHSSINYLSAPTLHAFGVGLGMHNQPATNLRVS